MRLGPRNTPGRGRFPSGPGSLGSIVLNPPSGTTVREQETQWLMANVAAGTSVTWLVNGVSVGSSSAAWGGLAWTPGAAGTYSVQAQVGASKSTAITVTAAAEVTLDVANLAYVRAYYDGTAGKTVSGGRVSAWSSTSAANTYAPSASQGTGGLQPWTCKLRGRDAIRLGTGGERLTGTSGSTLAQTWHQLAVHRSTQSNGTNTPAPALFGSLGLRFAAAAAYYPRTLNGAAGVTLTGPSVARSTAGVGSMKGAGASGSIRWNGSAINGTIGTSSLATGTAYGIGAASGGTLGHCGAVGDVVVTQGMADADWTTLENYLIAKYRTDQPSASLMWVGDSITVGDGSTDGDGYRSLFGSYQDRYRFAGKWVECVGPTEEAGFLDDSHYASSGKSIQWMQTNLIPRLTSAFQPDVISVLIGTNNVRENSATWVSGTGAGSTYADLVTLLQSIASAVPGAVLVLWTLPPLQNATYEARALELNANIPAALAASGLPGLVLDSRLALPTWNVTDQPDGIHPSDAGYAKILPYAIDAVRKAVLL